MHAIITDWHDQLKVDFVTPDPVTGKVGVENERFIVWMRTSTFDLLRNKYAYISGLKKGKYQIEIEYRKLSQPILLKLLYVILINFDKKSLFFN